ncbi:MAG: sugar phosphate isomerase/epimerase [Proteobacteria bacterium]|nr:sugar phosphate isomerase/epimerase [Pseudomonadota bacterium]
MNAPRARLGVISMFYARPFLGEHFARFGDVRRADLDFIELLVPEPGELDLAATRRALADAGLGVVLAARVNPTRDLASADPRAREAGERYLRYCVDIAMALGAEIVGGPLYGAPLVFAGRAPAPVAESERARRIDCVVGGLRAASAYAGDTGVRFAVEPLNRFETDMANTTRHGIDLVARVDHAACGLLLDTFHMNMEDSDLPAAIRAAGAHVIHFQANENHRGFVGTGHVDWRGVGRALAAIGYAGPITLEPFRRDDERLGVPLAQWRPPNRDEGPDLAASVRILREAFGEARGA